VGWEVGGEVSAIAERSGKFHNIPELSRPAATTTTSASDKRPHNKNNSDPEHTMKIDPTYIFILLVGREGSLKLLIYINKNIR